MPFRKWRGTGLRKHFVTCSVDSSTVGEYDVVPFFGFVLLWILKQVTIMAIHCCFSLLGDLKGTKQRTKQSTREDKEATTTTGCDNFEPKTKNRKFKNHGERNSSG